MDRVGLSRPAQRQQIRLSGLVAGGLGMVMSLAAAAAPTALQHLVLGITRSGVPMWSDS